MRRYTILHAIETGGPGGAETVLVNLVSNLNSGKFRSIVLLPDDRWLNQTLKKNGIHTVQQSPSTAGVIKQMVRLIREENVDLVHSHLPDQNSYSCLAALLTRRSVVSTYHGEVSNTGKSALKLRVVRHFSTATVAVSDYLRTALREAGFPNDKLCRIYNGVDLERFAASEKHSLRTELGIPADAQIVVTVANLRASKGYNFLVKAARKVVDKIPNTVFLAIGQKDPVIEKQLSTLVSELRLESHFFFTGLREDVPALLKDVDLFVLSSTTEGLSIATIEAMAAGRPVVVTRSGGPQEIVDHGRTGLLVAPGDEQALAQGICELLSNPQRAAELAKAGQADVSSRFSLTEMVSQYEKLYLRCMNGGA